MKNNHEQALSKHVGLTQKTTLFDRRTDPKAGYTPTHRTLAHRSLMTYSKG